MSIHYRAATVDDCATILGFIRDLAAYEKLADCVTANEETLRKNLFGSMPRAECVLAIMDDKPVGFALFFHNFSTFLGKAGLYVEDVFVSEAARGQGLGKGLFRAVAQIAHERDCERMDWQCLNWNQASLDFYQQIGASQRQEWVSLRLDKAGIATLALPRKDSAANNSALVSSDYSQSAA